jgi:putative transcriptional regulator
MNNRIREFRAKLGITQDELARRANVRRETIVFLEKNKYNPSLKLAWDLSRIFSVAIEELFIFGEEDEK